MSPRIALCISLSVLLLCMACGGANGFDADESRMRSVSGQGFDSPHLHPQHNGCANGGVLPVLSRECPPAVQGVGPSLPRSQPTDGHGELPVPRSVRLSYRAGVYTNWPSIAGPVEIVVLPEKPIQLSMPPLPPHQTTTTTMTPTTTTLPQMRLITHGTETKPGEESPPVSEPTLAELIGQNFKMEDWAWALQVAFCESSAQPEDTHSKALHRRSGASGWFQHLPKFWEERTEAAGVPGADIMDPETNVVIAAYLLYETPQGTGHWYPSESCWG